MNGGKGGVGRTEGSMGSWAVVVVVVVWVCVCVAKAATETKEVCRGKPQQHSVCVFLSFVFSAGYFKQSFLIGRYQISVSRLCWMVRGSFLCLESSSLGGNLEVLRSPGWLDILQEGSFKGTGTGHPHVLK